MVVEVEATAKIKQSAKIKHMIVSAIYNCIELFRREGKTLPAEANNETRAEGYLIKTCILNNVRFQTPFAKP